MGGKDKWRSSRQFEKKLNEEGRKYIWRAKGRDEGIRTDTVDILIDW